MATEAALISRIRLELGDNPMPFRGQFRGNGIQKTFDLPAVNVSGTDLKAYTVTPAMVFTDLTSADYTLDPANGLITLTNALSRDDQLVVEGNSFSLFNDVEIKAFGK